MAANQLRRRNLQIIFNNTTLIPFKWRGKYMCFFCGDDLSGCDSLREHTEMHGHCSDKDRALKLVKAEDAEVKIDVSNISCRLCNVSLTNFEEIVDHLIAIHKLPYNRSVSLLITAYRLVDLKCLECVETFKHFGKLISHVNICHPTNCFTCEVCGQKFNKNRDLRSHFRTRHKITYDCLKCTQFFNTFSELQTHKANSHTSTCNVCLKSFGSDLKRLKHMKTEHKFDGKLQCKLCLKVMTTKQAFLRHSSKCNPQCGKIGLDDEEKKTSVKILRNNIACILNMSTALPFKFFMSRFRCFYCPKDFTLCDELKDHTVTEHPFCDDSMKSLKLRNRNEVFVKVDISTLSCKLCYQAITDLDSLIDHIITEHKARYDKSVPNILHPYKLIKENYPCPSCGIEYRYFGILLKHISNDHNDNRKICIYCGKAFRCDPNLRNHINLKHRTAIHKCSYCGLDFRTVQNLHVHMANSHGVKLAKCPQCPERFLNQYAVKRHLINSHNSGHKCAFCNKLFPKHSFMLSHLRRLHLKEKNVECSVCFEKFFDGTRLKMHMVKHIGERNFHCDVCGKKYLWKKNLLGHMATHYKSGPILK